MNDTTHVYVGAGGQVYAKSFSDLGEQPISVNPKYVTIDARLGLESSNGWRFGVFGRNIFGKDYWTSNFRNGDGYAKFAGQPRSYGFSASYSF